MCLVEVALEEAEGRFRSPHIEAAVSKPETPFDKTRRRLRDEVIGWATRFQISVEEGHTISAALPYCTGLVNGVEREIYVRALVADMGDGDSNAFLEFFTARPEAPTDGSLLTISGEIIPAIKSGREGVRSPGRGSLDTQQMLETWSEMFDLQVTLTRLDSLYPSGEVISTLSLDEIWARVAATP